MTQPSENDFRIQDIKLPGMSEGHPQLGDATVQKITNLLKSRTLAGPSLTGSEDPSFVTRAVSAPGGLGPNINGRRSSRRSLAPDGDSWRSRCVKNDELFGPRDSKAAKSGADASS